MSKVPGPIAWLDDPDRYKHPYLTLAGNRNFYFGNFGPDDIDLYSVAHSLSRICRFAGHGKHFYSVAHHSLRVLEWVKEHGGGVEAQLWALLHDASEFVVTDIPTPFKRLLRFLDPETGMLLTVTEFEERVQKAIAQRFNLCWPMPDVVHDADQALIRIEAEELFGDRPFAELSIDRVQVEFWRCFNLLENERNKK